MNNLEMMRKRLEYQGGINQEDRMIKDKYKTFLKTLKYSYQGADVFICQKHSSCEEVIYPAHRALINPNKLKQDYDDKIVSIDYDAKLQPGDVFEWMNTQSYWLVYLEALTEDAYFRGDIRRCKYKIKFKDADGQVCETWAAIRGPVETQIESIQKNQIRIDNPNWSLNILMPLNEQTLAAFDRYSEFLFAGRCWRVQAVDSISMRNILEIAAEEYYIDRDTDDVQEELKNGLVIEPVNPSPESVIEGETFIKPKIAEKFIAPGQGTWKAVCSHDALTAAPVQIDVDENDSSIAMITWLKTTSGQFNLIWTDAFGETDERTIVVESLF